MIRNIDNFNFQGQKALIRVDYNVPLDLKLNITDDKRIIASMPTIKKILSDGGMAIIMSHLGRPKGVKVKEMSLRPVANYLSKSLNTKVHFAEDCNTDVAKQVVSEAKLGEVVLLENLRYYAEEEANDDDFATNLASLGDVYVNDAFGTAHRAHASTYSVAKKFENRFAGKLIEKEMEYLEDVINNPKKPFTAIIGGAKVSGKIDVIENLFSKCDNILIGGGMVFTFLKAQGLEVGKSLVEDDKLEMAKKILVDAKANNVNLVLPTDIVVAKEFKNDTEFKNVSIENIPSDFMGLDIGIESTKSYAKLIENSNTVLWNGPMGVFEMDNFAKGTIGVAEALATATSKGANTIVGGGDSVAAIRKLGFEDKVSHISTGGGASLEFLEGKKLPGIEALR
ncbi:MAG: phosphoglycerate kinase [Ignavibacteriae bacterium HGW-Ignavibacteriae-4]|jgi:phosphoglycerate kinase|nr:MAG: phosphoglycerate kinase [Ignavibacteriae bacterium HGW-Ignavibacteriae-4]